MQVTEHNALGHERTRDGRVAKPGDILVFAKPKGISRIITFLTRSRFYHVGLFAGASYVVEARPRGVIYRDLRSRESGHSFVLIPAPDGQGRKALAWAESQIGDKYDNVDVAVMLIDRILGLLEVRRRPNPKYTCGEFVVTAYEQAGVRLFPDIETDEVLPLDFERFTSPHTRPTSFPGTPDDGH